MKQRFSAFSFWSLVFLEEAGREEGNVRGVIKRKLSGQRCGLEGNGWRERE
jgi:hypothetical protein